MTHSPHANFSTSFSKKMFVYIILFLGLIFGALNAMGAFAVNQKTTIKDSKAKLTLASSEKNVKANTVDQVATTNYQNENVVYLKVPQSNNATSFSPLDYSILSSNKFQPISSGNYTKIEPQHLVTINGLRFLNANKKPVTGKGVVIRVIDPGLNTHLTTFLDQNGNSRVVEQRCYGLIAQVAPCNTNEPAFLECSQLDVGCFHGNAVTDLAAGNRYSETISGGKKITTGGVAPGASISFSRVTLNRAGELDQSLLVQALNGFLIDIKYGKSYAPDIINISIGFPRDGKFSNCNVESEIKSTIDSIVKLGVTIVASSGNSSSKNEILFPACLDNVISVGATKISNGNETIADFSQTSKELDVVAPGSDLMIVRPEFGSFSSANGTSFATPIISGTIALLKEVNPGLTSSQIKNILVTSGDYIYDKAAGYKVPRVNVFKALQKANSGISKFDNPRV